MAWLEDTSLQYKGVCASMPGSEWSDTEATVLCKERGFMSGRALKPGTYEKKELADISIYVKVSILKDTLKDNKTKLLLSLDINKLILLILCGLE